MIHIDMYTHTIITRDTSTTPPLCRGIIVRADSSIRGGVGSQEEWAGGRDGIRWQGDMCAVVIVIVVIIVIAP